MAVVETKLKEMGLEYVQRRVEEGGIYVDQLFFHDPDGFMIEICNCDNLPVVPLVGEPVRMCSRINFKKHKDQIQAMQQQQHMVLCLPTPPVHIKEDYLSCAWEDTLSCSFSQNLLCFLLIVIYNNDKNKK